MCNREHRPEPYTLGGMSIVICDDIPSRPGFFGYCFSNDFFVSDDD